MTSTTARSLGTRTARPLAAVALLGGLVLATGCSAGEETGPASGGEPAAAAPAAAQPSSSEPAAKPASAADAAAERAPAPKAHGPKLEVAKMSHDFGKVYDIETVKATFPFKNVGDEKLVVSQVKPSCGCTAAALDRTVFEPGEGDEIKVEFTPKGIGRQTKTIDIMSNSSMEPVIRLQISASVTEFVRFEPRSMQFGKVAVGQEHEMMVDVISLDPNLEITSLVTQSPYLKASLLPGSVAEKPGVHSVVKLTLDKTAPWGQFRTTLLMGVRGTLPEGQAVDHRVTGNVFAELYGKVQADPAFYAVGAVEPGSDVDSDIVLTRPDGEPFEVVEAAVESMSFEGLEVTPVKTADGVRLRLHGPTGTYKGNLRGWVRVKTDVPGEPEMRFQVMGIVRDFTQKDRNIRLRKEAQERADALHKAEKLGKTAQQPGSGR